MTIYPPVLVVVLTTTSAHNQPGMQTNVIDVDSLKSIDEALLAAKELQTTGTIGLPAEADAANADSVAISKIRHRINVTEIESEYAGAANDPDRPG